jgi:hypothetical protein
MVIRGWNGLRLVTKRLVRVPSLLCVQLVCDTVSVTVPNWKLELNPNWVGLYYKCSAV